MSCQLESKIINCNWFSYNDFTPFNLLRNDESPKQFYEVYENLINLFKEKLLKFLFLSNKINKIKSFQYLTKLIIK